MPRSLRADLATWPNALCGLRLVLLAISMVTFYQAHYVVAFTTGIVGGMTDYVDGWLARRLGQTSELGALLDQVTDLLFTFTCLTLLTLDGVWPWPLLLLWGFRDISVLALRTSAAQLGVEIPSSPLGKWASNFIFYAIVFGFGSLAAERGVELGAARVWIDRIGLGGLCIGIAMQWIAGLLYVRRYAQCYGRS